MREYSQLASLITFDDRIEDIRTSFSLKRPPQKKHAFLLWLSMNYWHDFIFVWRSRIVLILVKSAPVIPNKRDSVRKREGRRQRYVVSYLDLINMQQTAFLQRHYRANLLFVLKLSLHIASRFFFSNVHSVFCRPISSLFFQCVTNQ